MFGIRFVRGESGAVSVDYMVLTGMLVGLGVVVASQIGGGTSTAATNVQSGFDGDQITVVVADNNDNGNNGNSGGDSYGGGTSDPAPSNPEPEDPVTPDPEPEDPVTPDPEPSDPEPTDPEPSDPEPDVPSEPDPVEPDVPVTPDVPVIPDHCYLPNGKVKNNCS